MREGEREVRERGKREREREREVRERGKREREREKKNKVCVCKNQITLCKK